MVRIVKDYDERRAEILATSQQLFMTLGYEKTPISTILETLKISKGTFYHYFESKEELLEAIVANMVVQAQQEASAILENPALNSLQKLNLFFDRSKNMKLEYRDLMLSLMHMLYSDDNVRLRNKLYERQMAMVSPILAGFIEQGIQEGIFTCTDARVVAESIVMFSNSVGELLGKLMLECIKDPSQLPALETRLRVYADAFMRILGAPLGSIELFDKKTVRRMLALPLETT